MGVARGPDQPAPSPPRAPFLHGTMTEQTGPKSPALALMALNRQRRMNLELLQKAEREMERTEETYYHLLSDARRKLAADMEQQSLAEDKLTEQIDLVEALEESESHKGGGGESEELTLARLTVTALEAEYVELSAGVFEQQGHRANHAG